MNVTKPGAGPASLLLLDDETAVCRALVRLLGVRGIQTKGCSSPDEFMILARTGKHRALLVDWNLRDREGTDLIAQLRSEGESRPIGLMSGNVTPSHGRELAEEAGADVFIAKVIDTSTFVEEVQALLVAIVPAIQWALAPGRPHHARLAEVGLAAALDAVPAAAVVVRLGGHVLHANACARHLLSVRSSELDAELVDAVASGGNDTWSCTRLVAKAVPPHFLLVRRDPIDDLEARLARAAAKWDLTPRNVDVLRWLVRGEANKAIADRLGCAVITVEVHVSALLAKAGAQNRTELVSRVLGH